MKKFVVLAIVIAIVASVDTTDMGVVHGCPYVLLSLAALMGRHGQSCL